MAESELPQSLTFEQIKAMPVAERTELMFKMFQSLVQLSSRLDALTAVVAQQPSKTKTPAGDAVQPEHAPGFCGTAGCPICAPKGQEISDAAFKLGQESVEAASFEQFKDELDEILLLAGGAPLRDNIAKYIAYGAKLRAERNQPLVIAP